MPSDYLVVYRCIFIMLMKIHGQVQLCVVSIYCSNYVIGAGGGSRRIEDCERQLLRICYTRRRRAGLLPRAPSLDCPL